jgi:predicted ATPase/transcriptional regulator with XRE-family HTH domain
MSTGTTFGEVLRHLRKRAGLTQGDLAAAAGCSVSYISALETGQRRPDAGMVRTQLAPALAAAGDARLLDRLQELAAAASAAIDPAQTPAAQDAGTGGLFGRDADIDALCQRLESHPGRLLTLLGPPGVGKTSLAQAVVRALATFFAGGAHTVWLGEVSGSELVAAAIATALHLVEDTRPPAARLIDQLRSRELLLFLDNFDDFARDPVTTALVADLLKACPRLRILVTSRERLRLRAEQIVQLQPLDSRSAVALFIARARSHQPGYAPSPAEQEAIAELCRRLDNLPLAVELIAAHAPEMTVPDLLAHLRTDRLALLGKRATKLSAEQRTLTAALQHSYALLAPAEQRALRLVSVFDGGVALEGVAALAISLPVVQALADKSLLRLESVGEVRRVRLLETVREYAAMLLTAAGEFDDAQQRRLAWCVALAEQAAPLLQSAEQTRWLQRLEPERYNFFTAIHYAVGAGAVEAALRLVVALRHFWVARNHLAEIAPWFDVIEYEAQNAAIGPELRARFLNCQRDDCVLPRPIRSGRRLFSASVPTCQRGWRPAGDRLCLRWVGRAGGQSRPLGGAARMFSATSLDHATASGDAWLAGIALMNLGEIARMEGDIAGAAAHYRASLSRLQQAGDPYFSAVAEINLGQVYLHQGDLAQAEAVLRQALAAGLDAESVPVVAPALEKLAGVLAPRDGATAGRCFGLAQALRQASGVAVQPADLEDYDRLVAQFGATPAGAALTGGGRIDWHAIRAAAAGV